MADAETFRYTFGIEEEFFLSHAKSRSLALDTPLPLTHAKALQYVVDWLTAATYGTITDSGRTNSPGPSSQ